jgi:hypothetical protein
MKNKNMESLTLSFLSLALLITMNACNSDTKTTDNTSNSMEQSKDTTPAGVNLTAMSDEQKMQQQKYFTEHSFEFSPYFKKYHPGPHWIIANAKEFELTEEQSRQQKELNDGMAKATIMANKALKAAYQKYEKDAAMDEPVLEVLNNDIEAIGKAQTHLAQVMIPYHLNSYKALNDKQKAVYKKLVAQQ